MHSAREPAPLYLGSGLSEFSSLVVPSRVVSVVLVVPSRVVSIVLVVLRWYVWFDVAAVCVCEYANRVEYVSGIS